MDYETRLIIVMEQQQMRILMYSYSERIIQTIVGLIQEQLLFAEKMLLSIRILMTDLQMPLLQHPMT